MFVLYVVHVVHCEYCFIRMELSSFETALRSVASIPCHSGLEEAYDISGASIAHGECTCSYIYTYRVEPLNVGLPEVLKPCL